MQPILLASVAAVAAAVVVDVAVVELMNRVAANASLSDPAELLHLDASVYSSFVFEDPTSSSITAWESVAGNSTQLTTLVPVLHTTSAPFTLSIPGGHPTLNMSTGVAGSVRAMTAAAAFNPAPADVTLLYVGTLYDIYTSRDICCPLRFAADGDTPFAAICARDNLPSLDFYPLNTIPGYDTPNETISFNVGVPPGARVMLGVQHSATAGFVELWVNGALYAAGPTTQTFAGATLQWLGASDNNFNYAGGAVNEVLLTPLMNEADLATTFQQLSAKWGIPM